MKKPELVLRTCNPDMLSYGGFRWPTSGPVEAPDWDPAPKCGQGLHGLRRGIGDYDLLSIAPDAKWLVVKVRADELVAIDKDKVKFRRGEVVYCGSIQGAFALVSKEWARIARHSTTGLGAPASTAGDGAPASTAGDGAPASTAGPWAPASTAGPWAPASTAGDGAPASTAGDGAPASTAGPWAPASTAGLRAPASTAGECSTAVCLGLDGQARAGKKGAIVLTWWDETTGRQRLTVAYVGEGIEAHVWYRIRPGSQGIIEPAGTT